MTRLLRPAIFVLLAWALVQGGVASVKAAVSSSAELAAEVSADRAPPLEEPDSDPPEGEESDEAPETEGTACAPRADRCPSFAITRLQGADDQPGDAVADPPSPPPRR